MMQPQGIHTATRLRSMPGCQACGGLHGRHSFKAYIGEKRYESGVVMGVRKVRNEGRCVGVERTNGILSALK